MRLAVVTFHIDAGPAGSTGSVHPNANLARAEYLTMIDLMFRSARIFHPNCRTIVVSNSGTDLSALGERYEIWRMDAKPETLMLDRTRAMSEVVKRIAGDTFVVFLDSDILVNGNLDPLLQDDFDIGLTFRDHTKHPINGGVIIVQPRRPQVVQWFFRRAEEIYVDRHSEASSWFGDQDAILDLIGTERFAGRKTDMVNVEGCAIRLLPCEKYNFSPDASPAAIRTPLSDRLIVHFKGERKALMPMFWRAYLALHESANPMTRLRAASQALRLRFAR